METCYEILKVTISSQQKKSNWDHRLKIKVNINKVTSHRIRNSSTRRKPIVRYLTREISSRLSTTKATNLSTKRDPNLIKAADPRYNQGYQGVIFAGLVSETHTACRNILYISRQTTIRLALSFNSLYSKFNNNDSWIYYIYRYKNIRRAPPDSISFQLEMYLFKAKMI